jgi:hypothetical protein
VRLYSANHYTKGNFALLLYIGGVHFRDRTVHLEIQGCVREGL